MNNIKKLKLLLKIILKISPSYLFLVVFGSLLSSFQVFINVILPKYLIDELLGEQNVKTLIIIGGAIVLLNLFFTFINKTYRRFLDVKNEYVRRKVQEDMGKKIMSVEYRHLEDPYYLDLKERAVFTINNQNVLSNTINNLATVIGNIITLLGLIVILFTLSYLLLIVLLVGITITLIIGARFKNYQTKFFTNLIPINRRYTYYFMLSLDQRIQKDIRLYNMSPLFINRVIEYNKEIYDHIRVFYRHLGISTGLQRVVNAIQTGIIYLYVSFRVFSSKFGAKISIGDFTMYINTAINFTKNFDQLLESFTIFIQMLKYLDPLMEFMELEDVKNKKSDIYLEEIKKIEFKNVSFRYPKAEKDVLSNISFSFSKGEKISIVGLNGAGKTTLIKILCRMYQPTEGKILINDIDIFDYDYQSYINKIAAVFQDYRLFAYSILENITGSNEDNDKVEKIIDQVGLSDKLKDLPKGINTCLNKNFDEEGVELSGGQGQKVAIARALYKNADLVVLDEPTSALDPIAEADIYKNFNELVLSKTAIYISHRMSSSVFCDKVLIIENGRVADYDTHPNLMKKTDSLYYKLFTSQSKNYQIN